MKQAICIKELPPITGFEDQLHFRYECPFCHQERRMVHAFIEGKRINENVKCVTCKRWYELFVPSETIKRTKAWIRRERMER